MSGSFRLAYPNAGSYSATTNMDQARGSLQMLRESIIANGICPGFDLAATTYFAGTTNINVLRYEEKTAHAAADTPARSGAQRIFFRITCSNYTAGGLVQKIRFELSSDSGSTYSNWTDLGGNAFVNLTWNADGTINTYAWGTS